MDRQEFWRRARVAIGFETGRNAKEAATAFAVLFAIGMGSFAVAGLAFSLAQQALVAILLS